MNNSVLKTILSFIGLVIFQVVVCSNVTDLLVPLASIFVGVEVGGILDVGAAAGSEAGASGTDEKDRLKH